MSLESDMYICINIHIHMYTHIHIYVYLHMYTRTLFTYTYMGFVDLCWAGLVDDQNSQAIGPTS